MKKIMKKAITAIICTMLLVVTMGVTVLAANGDIWGILDDDVGTVCLENTSGTMRYCVVVLREYDGYNANNYTIVSSAAKNVLSGKYVFTAGTIKKSHAKGVGFIYNSTAYESGVASTLTTQIK